LPAAFESEDQGGRRSGDDDTEHKDQGGPYGDATRSPQSPTSIAAVPNLFIACWSHPRKSPPVKDVPDLEANNGHSTSSKLRSGGN
jgi:hypothetical protein